MNAPMQTNIGAMHMARPNTGQTRQPSDTFSEANGLSQACKAELRSLVDEVMAQRMSEIGPMLQDRLNEGLERFFSDNPTKALSRPSGIMHDSLTVESTNNVQPGGLLYAYKRKDSVQDIDWQAFARKESTISEPPDDIRKIQVVPSGQAWGEGRDVSPGSIEDDTDARHLVGVARMRTVSRRFGHFLKGATRKLDNASGWSRARVFCTRLVLAPAFDWTICAFILLNAGTLGLQTEYMASTLDEDTPESYTHVERVFAVIFVMELALRLFVFRQKFFYMPGWPWNVFDFCIVGLQLVEEILSPMGQNPSFTRLLKLLRLVRAIRVARVARLIRELRTLVISMTRSLKSLGWTCALMFLLIYTISLFLTQAVSDHRRSAGEDDDEDLRKYYSSLPLTMLTLFEAISGGEDWGNLLMPLVDNMSVGYAFLFVFYISFAIFALMNVVTGIFVDSVLLSAKHDKEAFLLANAREIFREVEGGMDLQAFLDKVDSREMQEFFRGIDVDSSQAHRLFHLVDLDGSGEINAEEFLSSCVRLNGPAKALDTAVLVQEVGRISGNLQRLEKHQGDLRRKVGRLAASVRVQDPPRPSGRAASSEELAEMQV